MNYERYFLQEGSGEQHDARMRGTIDFVIDGDLRFLSHQEMLRMFARSCARAQVPVRHTEGFNPHPRISLPLPRPVGIASDAERVVIDLAEAIAPATMLDLLAAQMPEGIAMHQARMLQTGERCIPCAASYQASIVNMDPDELASRADRLLEFAPIAHQRFVHKTGATVRVDLRPFIDQIDVTDTHVRFKMYITGGGAAKPSEICQALGFDGQHVNHLIRRTEIEWRQTL